MPASPTSAAKALALQGHVDDLASLVASAPPDLRVLEALEYVLETVPPKSIDFLLPTGAAHQEWYMERARRIDAVSGFLDYARDLLEIGVQKTNASPESALAALLVQATHLIRLVYECGFDEGLTLERWEKMSILERLQACASNAGPNDVAALLEERFLPMYASLLPVKAAPYLKALRDYCVLRIDEHGGVDLCRAIVASSCVPKQRVDGRLLIINTCVAAFHASKRFSTSVCAQYETLFASVPSPDPVLESPFPEFAAARLALDECAAQLKAMKVCERWGRKLTPHKLKSLSPADAADLVDSMLLHGQRQARRMTPPGSPGGGAWTDESWMRLLDDALVVCECLGVDAAWARARAAMHMMLGGCHRLARGLLEDSALCRDAVGAAVTELFTAAGDAVMLGACKECIEHLPAELATGSAAVRRVQGMIRALETLSACGVDDVVPLALHQAVEAGRATAFLEQLVARHPAVYAAQDSALGRPGARLMRVASHLGLSTAAAQRLVVLAALDAGDTAMALQVGERALADAGAAAAAAGRSGEGDEDAWRVADALRDCSALMRAEALARCPADELFVSAPPPPALPVLERLVEAGFADPQRRGAVAVAAIAHCVALGSLSGPLSAPPPGCETLALRGLLGSSDARWVLDAELPVAPLPESAIAALAPQAQALARSLAARSSNAARTETPLEESALSVLAALEADREPLPAHVAALQRDGGAAWVALLACEWDRVPWPRLGQALALAASPALGAKAEALQWLGAHAEMRAAVGRLVVVAQQAREGQGGDWEARFAAAAPRAEALDACARVAPSLADPAELPQAAKRLAAACEAEPRLRPSEILEAVVERQLGLLDDAASPSAAHVPAAFAAKRYTARLRPLVAKLVPADAAALAESLAFRGAGRLALATRLQAATDAAQRCAKDAECEARGRRALARLRALAGIGDDELAARAEAAGEGAAAFLALRVDATALLAFVDGDEAAADAAVLAALADIEGEEDVASAVCALDARGHLREGAAARRFFLAPERRWGPRVCEALAEAGVVDGHAVGLAATRALAKREGWADVRDAESAEAALELLEAYCRDAQSAAAVAEAMRLLGADAGARWLAVLSRMDDAGLARFAAAGLSADEQAELVARAADSHAGVRFGLGAGASEAARAAAHKAMQAWSKDEFMSFWALFRGTDAGRVVAELCRARRFKQAAHLAAMRRGVSDLLPGPGDRHRFLVAYLEDQRRAGRPLAEAALAAARKWLDAEARRARAEA